MIASKHLNWLFCHVNGFNTLPRLLLRKPCHIGGYFIICGDSILNFVSSISEVNNLQCLFILIVAYNWLSWNDNPTSRTKSSWNKQSVFNPQFTPLFHSISLRTKSFINIPNHSIHISLIYQYIHYRFAHMHDVCLYW